MPETQRFRVDLSYDGSYFHGWAAQPGLRTVQSVMEEALETITRVPVKLTVAGRTDAGVHARGQVAHFDVPKDLTERITARRLQGLVSRDYSQLWSKEALQKYLTKAEASSRVSDITIRSLTPVADTFDARFSAAGRSYEYRIADGAPRHNPLTRGYEWWQSNPLDASLIQSASAHLLGEWNFLSFCRPREGATTIRTLKEIRAFRAEGRGPLRIHFHADAFCHSMVRSLVGALVEVGRGAKDASWLESLLNEPSRDWSVPVAPARGLTLMGVEYPPESKWQERAERSRKRRKIE